MADHLASIHGTERDNRKHIRPTYSATILLPNLYVAPTPDEASRMTKQALQEHFDLFYQDIFVELGKLYGNIEAMIVCENLGDHLMGNVYVRFESELEAADAVAGLNERFYQGKPIYAELSPVVEFREACCRQHETGECTKGGFCNFMHPKRPTDQLRQDLFLAMRLLNDKRRRRR